MDRLRLQFEERLDYIESFTQVFSADANRILIATSVWFGTHLVSNDFQCFYLESEIVEDVYVEQPKGFVVVGREDDVCKLRDSVYGTPQSGHRDQNKQVKAITGPAEYKMHDRQPMTFHRMMEATM